MRPPRTCVTADGRFTVGLHRPAYQVANRRPGRRCETLGHREDGGAVDNGQNFPQGDLDFPQAAPIFEIANIFPFRGVTYIGKGWADRAAADPGRIRLPVPEPVSCTELFSRWFGDDEAATRFAELPQPLLLALATSATDPRDLVTLARLACELEYDEKGRATGVAFRPDHQGRLRPHLYNEALFEALVNNPALPDDHKVAMVLRPGIQGDSPIVGEVGGPGEASHIYEYLRANSYIPYGHYAANMAEDAVRYDVRCLSETDLRGLRFLYYQRTYLRLAAELGLELPAAPLDDVGLEELRQGILRRLASGGRPRFTATIWGWNYGFDYAHSGYRLHASHQQIHQQYAMAPEEVPATTSEDGALPAYACGDLVAECCRAFQAAHGRPFFDCLLSAIRNNQRTDGRTDLESSLMVWQDEAVLLYVPKAQTSQWELQLMPVAPVGHVLAADRDCRRSLDRGILHALTVLARLGARLVSTIEYSARLVDAPPDQRLLYSFLPKLPQSMGAFSEAQLRFINGHYPEDFARACRAVLDGA